MGQRVCRTMGKPCGKYFLSLSTATYMDIDYDAISGALVINAGWDSALSDDGWTETISREKSDGAVEIGVLMHEPNPDPEDVQFGGFLTVLGQDSKPSTLLILPCSSYANTILRTNTLPNPNSPFSPPLAVDQLKRPPSTSSSNLHHRLPTSHRPPPNPHPLLPLRTPDAPKSHLQTPYPPHAPVLPLHRQIPVHRPPLPVLQKPRVPTQSGRRHRPRSARLGDQAMGQRRVVRTRSPRCFGL